MSLSLDNNVRPCPGHSHYALCPTDRIPFHRWPVVHTACGHRSGSFPSTADTVTTVQVPRSSHLSAIEPLRLGSHAPSLLSHTAYFATFEVQTHILSRFCNATISQSDHFVPTSRRGQQPTNNCNCFPFPRSVRTQDAARPHHSFSELVPISTSPSSQSTPYIRLLLFLCMSWMMI